MKTASQIPERKRGDYTEGSIIGSILKMGLPSMFGFLAQHVYSMVDMYWVSRLPGEEAGVAAITFFGNILWFFFAFNQLIGPGSVAVISRRYGERDFDAAETAIKETITLKLIFGAGFGVMGFFFAETFLRLVGATGQSLALAVSYGRIMFLGLAIMYATYSVFTALRGVANPKMAMTLMVGSNVLNLVLDPIFIFGWFGMPAFGIIGAAYASVLSYTTTFTVGMLLFYGDYANIRLTVRGQKPMSLVSMWKIVKIGIPAWLGDMSLSGSRLLITPLIATFGTPVVAAYGVGTQVFGFGIMLLVGIGLGLSSLIGHNLGGRKLRRAKSTADQSVLLGIGIMVVFGAAVFAGAEIIMRLFFASADTVATGVVLLRIFALGFPFMGALITLEQIHMGVGLNTPAMITNIIHSWALQAVPILVLVRFLKLDQEAVWWVLAGSGVVASAAFYFYYRRGRWLRMKV